MVWSSSRHNTSKNSLKETKRETERFIKCKDIVVTVSMYTTVQWKEKKDVCVMRYHNTHCARESEMEGEVKRDERETERKQPS